jgi:CBS domain
MCRHSTSDADESWAPSRKIRLGGIRCPLSPADGRFARSSSFSGCIARSKDESLNYRGLDRGAHTAVRTARVTVGHVRRGEANASLQLLGTASSDRGTVDAPVGELMSKPVVTVTPETTIASLRKLMAEHDFNAFPVVNPAGMLQGIVTRLDLFRVYLPVRQVHSGGRGYVGLFRGRHHESRRDCPLRERAGDQGDGAHAGAAHPDHSNRERHCGRYGRNRRRHSP